MAHEIYSAVKGELVQVLLPLFAGEKKVRAALVVALGISPNPTETRLALSGGAHVDVSKSWMQKHAPAAGKHYFVLHEDGVAESHPAETFETSFAPQGEDLQQGGAGEQAAQPTAREVELEKQVATLTNERDGARARITQLEAQLAQASANNAPTAADLDATAEEQTAKDATSGQEEQSGQ